MLFIVWYTWTMARQLCKRILAFYVLLAYSFSAVGTGAWYCEGRQCGITLWGCCCDSESSRDKKCNLPSINKSSALMCPSGCNCVILDSPQSASAITGSKCVFSTAVSSVVLPQPTFLATYLEETNLDGNAVREPPLVVFVNLPLGLRAPPTV